jgi:3',5'-cyclic-nucleotide phosphodiesterase
MMPVNHGKNDNGNYESAAFFIRRDSSAQEFLFFGDVEPDSIANKPQNINVWRAAALKFPAKLSTLFIECSWPSGRSDDMLYGHLTPEHLAAELSVLATEVVKVRKSSQISSRDQSRPMRKKQKYEAMHENLRGSLEGLQVYVIHCKDSTNGVGRPTSHLIVEQVRALVKAQGLGAEIHVVEQGMLIGTLSLISFMII